MKKIVLFTLLIFVLFMYGCDNVKHGPNYVPSIETTNGIIPASYISTFKSTAYVISSMGFKIEEMNELTGIITGTILLNVFEVNKVPNPKTNEHTTTNYSPPSKDLKTEYAFIEARITKLDVNISKVHLNIKKIYKTNSNTSEIEKYYLDHKYKDIFKYINIEATKSSF